jgi:hypothetical protein
MPFMRKQRRLVDDVVLDRAHGLAAGVLHPGDLVRLGVRGDDRAVRVPHATVAVLEDAEVRAAVPPVQRGPEEEDLRHARRRRAAGLGLAHWSDPPRPVLRPEDARDVDGERPPCVADLSLPAPELREARHVHRDPRAGSYRLAPLLDTGRARDERQVALDAGLVRLEHDARAAHRLHDLDPERSDARVRRVLRCAPRAVKGVLLAVAHDREAAVQDSAVGIQAHPHGEVELPVVRVAVEPVAVVDVAVARRRVGDRLGDLVDRVVVESGEHAFLPHGG